MLCKNCLVCFRRKPDYRMHLKTCSKVCANAWNWLRISKDKANEHIKIVMKMEKQILQNLHEQKVAQAL